MPAVPALQPVLNLRKMRGVVANTSAGGSWGNHTKVLEKIQDLNPWVLRTGVFRGDTQRNWLTEIHNTFPNLKICGIAGKPTDDSGNPNPASDTIAYLAEYPAGLFSYLEGPNEWNLKHPRGDDDWSASLRTYWTDFYRLAKARWPNIPLVQPSLGKRTAYSEMGNYSSICDIGCAHAYTGGYAPGGSGDRIEEEIRNVRTVCGTSPKKIVVTEWGWHDAMHCPADQHKPTLPAVAGIQYAPYIFEYARTGDIDWMTSYELVDDSADPTGGQFPLTDDEHERHFGHYQYGTWARKPLAEAHRNVGLIIDRSYPGTVTWGSSTPTVTGASDAACMYYERPDGRRILCVWRRGVRIYDNSPSVRALVSPQPAAANVTITWSSARKVDVFRPHLSPDPIASLSSNSTTSTTIPLVAEAAMLVVGPTGSTPNPVTGTATFNVGSLSVSGTYQVT